MIKFVAAAAAVLTVGTAMLGLGGSPEYVITGHFLSAEGVTPGNDVLIAGVPVGTVRSVDIAPESDSAGGALIRMRINSRYAPLRGGTRATIRQKGFLGNMYIELAPGPDGHRPIANGGTLPLQDTAAPVDLDQVMDIFDPDTRARLKTLTLEGGRSLDQRGADLNHILADLPATSANLASATRNLDQSQQQLDDLTAEFDRIAQEMALEDQNLRGDLRHGASLLSTIAAREDRLQAEITNANLALGEVNAGLRGHEPDIATLLIELPALQKHLRGFSGTVDPALVDLNLCYPDIVNAIAGLRSSTDYRHPQGAQDANGYVLRVQTNVAPVQIADTGSLKPPVAACQGGTPTP
ncbi:MAG: MCE family protein [Candidatus Dormibacteraceae bacterium]